MPFDDQNDLAALDLDPVALLHEEASAAPDFITMESIRAKFLPTKRDAKHCQQH